MTDNAYVCHLWTTGNDFILTTPPGLVSMVAGNEERRPPPLTETVPI